MLNDYNLMYKSLFIAIAFAVQEVVKIETKTVNLFISLTKQMTIRHFLIKSLEILIKKV